MRSICVVAAVAILWTAVSLSAAGATVAEAVKSGDVQAVRTLLQKRADVNEEAIVEGPSRTDPSRLRGRTRHNKTVNFDGAARAGEMAVVEIEAATSTTLSGTEVLAAGLLA